MATRRMILSNIWEDDFVGSLSFFERLLWIGLFSRCADDQGRLLDNPTVIRAQVFPYDDLDPAQLDAALARFEAEGKIIRYAVKGKAFVQLVRWWENQRPQWANASKYPGPPGWVDHVRMKTASGRVVQYEVAYQEGDQEATQEGSQQAGQVVRHVHVHVYDHVHVQRECAPAEFDWPPLNDLAPDAPATPAPAPAPSPPDLEPARAKPPPKPPPTAAVKHYRQLAKCRENDAQRALIEQAERDVGSDRVMRAMTEWFEKGFKRTNVDGMITVAREGWSNNGRSTGQGDNHAKSQRRRGRADGVSWAEAEQVLRERDATAGVPERAGPGRGG